MDAIFDINITMETKSISERELPSPEERRQILQHAGIILNNARDLMARLDLHESRYPRSVREHQQVLERDKQQSRHLPL